MDIQRLRNLTTGRLHTEMDHVYEDFKFLIGESLFTHQLPNASRALEPWLKQRVEGSRFWDNKYDTTHVGEYVLDPLTEQERAEFWDRYLAQPSPFAAMGVA